MTVVQKALTSNIANGLKSVAMSAGCIGMLVYTSPSLAALSLALIPPVAVAGMFYGRFLQVRRTPLAQNDSACRRRLVPRQLMDAPIAERR